MRDLLVISIVIVGALITLWRPWIGIMLWTWLSIMNPHRYTYGMAYTAPLAAVAAGSVMLGWFITRERASPFKARPVAWLVLFMLWMTLSWLAGLTPGEDYEQWTKVMKIDIMIVLALSLLHSKKHIFALMLVCVGSLGFLGVKGGIFTLLTGGEYRVWGPPDSFIGGNNEIALALIMTIPLLRFFQLQLKSQLARLGLTASMLLCSAAALGSQSRGALLAISAMLITLWWRGQHKLRTGLLLVILALPLISFMPQEWSDRMSTIQTYEEDRSAMGRISAWWTAWNIALRYPTGVGFNQVTPELFARFSPYPDYIHAAHSIYFQVLGNHGFVGLFLFLGIWLSTWRLAGALRTQQKLNSEAQWTADLGAMCQVSLVGYAVGGAFLSLAYFDLPYNIMVLVVLAHAWVTNKAWQSEPTRIAGWKTLPVW